MVRSELVEIFNEKLRGKRYVKEGSHHNGSEGHFVEKMFGIGRNSSKHADYKGFEIKIVSPKTDILEKIADEYLFSQNGAPTLASVNGDRHLYLTKNKFIQTFGQPNEKKSNRFSWSGRSSPKYGGWNECGQTLVICPRSSNFYAIYSYKKERRSFAHNVPDIFKTGYVAIAVWFATEMKDRIDNKWNVHGFMKPVKAPSGEYVRLAFGRPFGFEHFVESVRRSTIVFDSGLVENANRGRSCSKFRGNSTFVNELYE